jgi:hypothetical protein
MAALKTPHRHCPSLLFTNLGVPIEQMKMGAIVSQHTFCMPYQLPATATLVCSFATSWIRLFSEIV